MAALATRLRTHDTLVALALLVAAVWVVGLLAGETLERQVVLGLMNLVAVVGLWVFSGTSGVLSFGHVAFMAVGAYTAGILAIPVDEKALLLPDLPGVLRDTSLSPLAATLAGGLVAAAFALVLCGPIMRLSGIAASLTTLAVLAIVYVVAANWQAVTGGTSGIAGVPERTTLTAAALWALAAVAIAYAVQRARWGRRLRASRDDELAAHSLGIGVARERRMAFVVSGLVLGIAGGLYGQFLGSFVPGTFYFDLTFLLLAMLVVGGIATLSGAVVGAVAIGCATELLREVERGVDVGTLHTGSVTGRTEMGIALVMLAVLIRRPGGLMGGRELTLPRLGLGRRSEAPAPDGAVELTFAVERDGAPAATLVVREPQLVVAGFTGRDEDAVERHIAELEQLGVPRPSSTPTLYLLPNWLLRTAGPAIEVAGERTSGEAEPVLVVMPDGARYVTVGSDVTDRALEAQSIDLAKLVCPKVVAGRAWPLDAVDGHWDALRLRAQLDEVGGPYQDEAVAAILHPQEIVAATAALDLDPSRPLVLFLGTVPLLDGGFRFDRSFAATLEDPVRAAALQCSYRVEALAREPYESKATTGRESP